MASVLQGQWYRACGTRLLRIVIVATDTGTIPWRVFFCTDASLSVPEILAGYGSRWSIECFFRDAKQLLGFSDSCAHKKQAVLRVLLALRRPVPQPHHNFRVTTPLRSAASWTPRTETT